MQRSDTIAAVATAMAGSGIGVIRISGEEAFAIAEKVFRPAKKDKVLHEQETYTIHYGKIMDPIVIRQKIPWKSTVMEEFTS